MTFTAILHSSAQLVGLTPGVTLANTIAESFASYLSRALQEVARAFQWPELLVVSEKFYRDDWASGTTYAADAEVYSPAQDKYYTSLQNTNLNHAVTDAAWWEETSTLTRYFARGTYDAIFSVHDEDPRGKRAPARRTFTLSGTDVIVGDDAPTSVWVYGRKKTNPVTTTAYSGSTSYAVGDVVYYTDGYCYVRTVAGSGNLPTDATKWEQITIPHGWIPALQYRAAADYARADGNVELARDFEAAFKRELTSAMADIAHNQLQTTHYEVAA